MKDIAGHPTNRLDASYWVGKANGEKAYKKDEDGKLIEDDVNGKAILKPEEKDKYNTTTAEIKKLDDSIKDIRKKMK